MALETGTYISDLVATNPASGDAKSQGDDHLRLIKSTVKATFPNVSGAVTPTHTELNYVDGVTSAIQTQINTKGAHAGQTWTGAHDFTGATVTVPTAAGGDNDTSAASTAFVAAAIAPLATLASPALTGTPTAPTATAGTNTTQIATTAFAQQLAFSAALPAQGGATNAFLRTDGASATWVEQVNASQAEMEAGTEAALRLVSPLRVAQAIAGQAPATASQAEMEAGTEAARRSMTPQRVAQAIAALSPGPGDHAVIVNTGNGHGSTNTRIRRFTTTQSSVGTAITYADSAANGASFTINLAGLYAIYYCDACPVGGAFGASVNSTQLTTGIESGAFNAANRLCLETSATTLNITTGVVTRLAVNDVVRPHTSGAPNGASALDVFAIRRVGV